MKLERFGHTARKNIIPIIFAAALLTINFLIYVLPYYSNGYKTPVGWDTGWYIRNMRLIDEQGLYAFFVETREINLFCILEYALASVFSLSFIHAATIIPIVIGLMFPLLNFKIISVVTGSWKLALLAMLFTIIDYNTIRMTAFLHRNLFCLLLIQIAFFLVLPDLLRKPGRANFGILTLLLVVAGLSQVETFAIALLVLATLIVFCAMRKSFTTARLVLFCTLAPALIVLITEVPFWPTLLGEHIVFNPSTKWFRQNFIAGPGLYVASLGTGLAPLYLAGLYHLARRTEASPQNTRYTLFLLWNTIAVAGSFLPWLGVRVPGWRLLLLTTVPPIATLGFHALFLRKRRVSMKNGLLLAILISMNLFTIRDVQARDYRPWISDEAYERLSWIGNASEGEDNVIFIMAFNYGRYTYEYAELYRNWVWATVGTKTTVYFGLSEGLLRSRTTYFESPFLVDTSQAFWNDIRLEFTLSNVSVYSISNWYKDTVNETGFMEAHPGIYWMRLD